MATIIAPSLLASDHTRLGMEVEKAERSGADWLHLDIMDGHFVPNISFGPQVVEALRPLTGLFFDAHLMCTKPEILLEPFANAGVDEITIHVELGKKVPALLQEIRSLGKKVGLAINPSTTIATVQPYLDQIDLLLVMTVNPGFGGQKFIKECLPKIHDLAIWRRERALGYRISVDGGINTQTAAECARAGADTFVSGTSLFRAPNLKSEIDTFRRSVNEARPYE